MKRIEGRALGKVNSKNEITASRARLTRKLRHGFTGGDSGATNGGEKRLEKIAHLEKRSMDHWKWDRGRFAVTGKNEEK